MQDRALKRRHFPGLALFAREFRRDHRSHRPSCLIGGAGGPSVARAFASAISCRAGVIRDAEGLSALSTLIHALEAEHGAAPALVAARFLTQGALAREESRGGHSRTDFPHTAPRGGHTRLKLADLYPAQAKLRQAGAA